MSDHFTDFIIAKFLVRGAGLFFKGAQLQGQVDVLRGIADLNAGQVWVLELVALEKTRSSYCVLKYIFLKKVHFLVFKFKKPTKIACKGG